MYASWMGGSLLLEKESDWEGALARFLRARCGGCTLLHVPYSMIWQGAMHSLAFSSSGLHS